MNVFVDRWWPVTEIPGQVGEASGAWEHQLQLESAGQQDEDRPEMAAAEPDDQGSALGTYHWHQTLLKIREHVWKKIYKVNVMKLQC